MRFPLLDDAMENCIMYDRKIVDDGYGGYAEKYFPGIVFEAAFDFDDSIEAQEAKAEGAVGVYTITTRRNLTLRFGDVLKRVSNGRYYRVLTNGDDKKTPKSTALDMRQVRAEEWTPTTGTEGGAANG